MTSERPSSPPLLTLSRNHHRRAMAFITAYTLLAISALLVLLLLIWHISTTHLVEKFDMPHIWEADFMRQQLKREKGVVWGWIFVVVE